MQLSPPLIHDHWDHAAAALDDALAFSEERLGVIRYDWLQYDSLMVVLAAIAFDQPLTTRSAGLKAWS